MRLSCEVELKEGIEIPKNFRQGLLSLIKESMKKGSFDGELFYKSYYSDNKQKPFTFSAFFPLKNIDGKSILQGNFFRFIFSTSSIEFLGRVYNGLLEIDKEGKFYLYGHPLRIKSCNLLKEKDFLNKEAKFKTISPFLLRKPNDGRYYLYPAELERSLNTNLEKFRYWEKVGMDEFVSKLEENLSRALSKDIKLLEFNAYRIVPVVCSSKSSNFISTYPGIKAYMKISAESEALKNLYDIGIGARRSEGFGMLEVVDE